MKTSKLFILASLLLAYSVQALACGPWYYTAEDNDIYRLLPYGAEGPALSLSPDFSGQNVALWSQQTKCKDTEAIRQAIYNGTLDDWNRLYLHPDNSTTTGWFANNAFVKQLAKRHDNDAIKLLYLSKQYETLRQAKASPWYYNGRQKSREDIQIQSIYENVQHWLSVNGKKKSKYADRYRFLAMKCCWAIGNPQATMDLWETLKPQLHGSIFYSEAEDYAARCLYHLGRTKEADNIYLQRGDIRSLMLIRKVDNLPQLLQLVLDIAPDSPTLPVELQRLLFSLENNPFTLENKVCADGYEDHEAVLRIAQQAAKTTILSRRAMWSYTAACLLDYNNKPAAALQQLEGIDKLPCDPFLQQSIRVLRFYLRCKTDKMSDVFEQYAIGELQWMDSELQKEWKQLSPKERKMYQHLESVQTGNLYRSCFMYDAMRRIVLPDSIGLAYRFALAERPVRALQVANMAENRFFILAGNTLIPNLRKGDRGTLYQWKSDVNQHPGFATAWCSWMDDDTTGSRGCAYNINWNGHDYCNWMFLLADKMEAKTLEAYRERQLHPLDATDRWFNERGYLGSDYWEDIIGTHHLRECNYPAAVEHLRLVSPAYQQCMNLSFELDPFSLVDKIPNQDKTGYRLHFAERMVELQKLMKSSDPDVSGTAMLEYSIGMRNSYDLCWYLTTYGRSSVKFVDPLQPLKPYEYAYRAEEAEWSWSPLLRLVAVNQKYKSRHTLEANVLQQKALKTIKSDEAKAQAYARLGKYETLVKRYTRTATAQHYARVCDEWRMYRL